MPEEKTMWSLSRRDALASAAVGAAFGLSKPFRFIVPAYAEALLEPTVGHYKYKAGSIEVTAIYDGIWRKPHDPTFIKDVSIEETKAALAKAGLTTDFMPIPLTVVVLKIGDKLIMVDAGSGVGQWQANATNLPANMKAAGIDHDQISTVLISHFHPDHVWGLMEKGTNAQTFPNAELVANAVEYKFWTEEGRVEKLPEGRRAAGKRIAENFPKWKNWKLVEAGAEVAPGVHILEAYGHTPGHSVFLVSSGKDQLMVSNDTMYVPAILAPHPEWQGAYDQDGPLAVATRRRIIDRVIADRMQICGAHFPFPGAGAFASDGGAYAFTPVIQS
jgi:glyoxylase-like metal-dependent hydrolase (beta-lactamase superfamily II)